MTSSTKPEVHFESQGRRRRIDSHQHMHRKFVDMWFLRYARGQTDTLVAILRSATGGVGEVRSDWSRDAAGTAQHDAANSSFVSLVTAAAAAAASAKLLLLLWRADLITRRRASERASDRHCAVARPTRHGESCADTSSRRPTPARRGEADGERAVERRSRAVAPGRRRRRCRCDVVALITAAQRRPGDFLSVAVARPASFSQSVTASDASDR